MTELKFAGDRQAERWAYVLGPGPVSGMVRGVKFPEMRSGRKPIAADLRYHGDHYSGDE